MLQEMGGDGAQWGSFLALAFPNWPEKTSKTFEKVWRIEQGRDHKRPEKKTMMDWDHWFNIFNHQPNDISWICSVFFKTLSDDLNWGQSHKNSTDGRRSGSKTSKRRWHKSPMTSSHGSDPNFFVLNGESLKGAIGVWVSIFPIYFPMKNGEPVGATSRDLRVSQPYQIAKMLENHGKSNCHPSNQTWRFRWAVLWLLIGRGCYHPCPPADFIWFLSHFHPIHSTMFLTWCIEKYVLPATF